MLFKGYSRGGRRLAKYTKLVFKKIVIKNEICNIYIVEEMRFTTNNCTQYLFQNYKVNRRKTEKKFNTQKV